MQEAYNMHWGPPEGWAPNSYMQMPQQPYGGLYAPGPSGYGGDLRNGPYYMNQSGAMYSGGNGTRYTPRGSFQNVSAYGGSLGDFAMKSGGGPGPGELSGTGFFRSYGMNSMGGFGGFTHGTVEPPPVVYKIFASRRDRSNLMSQRNFTRYPSEFSLRRGSYGSMPSVATSIVREKRSFMPVDSSGISKEPETVNNCDASTVSKEVKEDVQPKRPLSPVTYNIDTNDVNSGEKKAPKPSAPKEEVRGEEKKAKETRGVSSMSTDLNIRRTTTKHDSKAPAANGAAKSVDRAEKEKKEGKGDTTKTAPEKLHSVKNVSQSIPISTSLGSTSHNPPRVGLGFGGNESRSDLGSSALLGPGRSFGEHMPGFPGEEGSRPQSRSHRGSMRRRSSLSRARSASTVNMSVAEFPEAEEVQDGLSSGIAQHRRSSVSRLQMSARRSQSSPIGDMRQREERMPRENSNVAEEPGRPELRPEQAKKMRQEEQRRLDEEERKKNEEERLRRKSEERKRFEEEMRRAEQREEERIKNLLGDAESMENSEPKPRLVSRASSRSRPSSHPGALLRAIPEQPPELEVGMVRDNMADTLLSSREQSVQHGSIKTADHGGEGPTEHERERHEKRHHEEPHRHRADESEKQKQQQEGEVKHKRHQQDAREQRRANAIKTLVLLERGPQGSDDISADGNAFIYRGKRHEATEVVLRDSNSMSYRASLFNDIRDSVCEAHNAAIISVEAPNTGTVFDSPVWSGLIRIVSGVLRNNRIMREGTAELTAAFGFVYRDKVRDLFGDNDGAFEPLVVHPSPIYGPRIPHLHYGKVTSDAAFEEVMSSALRRANADPILTTRDGVAIAFLLSRQCRIITNEAGEKTCDVALSSLVVASSGSDSVPFESALARLKNEHSMLFHLVLGGPCHTCFMLNLSMAENSDKKNQETVEKLIELQGKMHASFNYPLRSGSVTRFVRYVESANREALERLKVEENPERRSRLERYVQEQAQLLEDANKMLAEVREELREKFPSLS